MCSLPGLPFAAEACVDGPLRDQLVMTSKYATFVVHRVTEKVSPWKCCTQGQYSEYNAEVYQTAGSKFPVYEVSIFSLYTYAKRDPMALAE